MDLSSNYSIQKAQIFLMRHAVKFLCLKMGFQLCNIRLDYIFQSFHEVPNFTLKCKNYPTQCQNFDILFGGSFTFCLIKMKTSGELLEFPLKEKNPFCHPLQFFGTFKNCDARTVLSPCD